MAQPIAPRRGRRLNGLVVVIVMVAACASPVASSEPSALPSPTAGPSATGPAAPSTTPPTVELEGQLFLGSLTNEQERYFVIVDGERQELFDAQGCHPCVSVSLDGRFVVHPFVTPGDGFSAAVHDLKDGRTTELAIPSGFSALGPGAISPDGERFVRHGWNDADPTVNGIYTSRLDGSDIRLVEAVTDGRGRDPLGWSPDGATLLVWSEDPTRTKSTHLGDLAALPADGGPSRVLNPTGTSVEAIINFGTPASFDPNGARVAFVARQTDDPVRSALFVADLASGGVTQVGDWAEARSSALWSPAGDWILVDREGEDGRDFSLVDPVGGQERELWSSEAGDRGCCPTWSPDGTRILFQRGVPGSMAMWVMGLDGEIEGRLDGVEPGAWMWYVWTHAVRD